MTVDTPALWIWGEPKWKVTWLLTPEAVDGVSGVDGDVILAAQGGETDAAAGVRDGIGDAAPAR